MIEPNKKTVTTLSTAVYITLILGLIFAAVSLVATYNEVGLGDMRFCLSSSCIERWSSANKYPLAILALTGSVIVGLITAGGIIIALLNYQSSVRASAIANHLSHLSLFSSYVNGEVHRRARISKTAVETMKWYNLIYQDSMIGNLDVSASYINFTARLSDQVLSSNKIYTSKENKDGGVYRYKDHQEAMILIFSDIGIYLERLPRIDFNEVEDQVLDLVRTVNLSFCRGGEIPLIPLRKYN